MIPVTLGVAMELLAAALAVKDDGPVVPEGSEGELGLSDSELWDAVWSRDFSLVINDQVPFHMAVQRDPRRIDAIIQGHLLDPISKPLFALQQAGPIQPSLLRSLFLMRLHAMREIHGFISAESIATAMEQEWDEYQRVLDRLLLRMVQAGDPVAQSVGKVLVENREPIRLAFDNARKAVSDAQEAAISDDDIAAWRKVLGVLDTSQARLLEIVAQLPDHLPEEMSGLMGSAELFGGADPDMDLDEALSEPPEEPSDKEIAAARAVWEAASMAARMSNVPLDIARLPGVLITKEDVPLEFFDRLDQDVNAANAWLWDNWLRYTNVLVHLADRRWGNPFLDGQRTPMPELPMPSGSVSVDFSASASFGAPFLKVPDRSGVHAKRYGAVAGPAITLEDIRAWQSAPPQDLDLSTPQSAGLSTALAPLPPDPLPFHASSVQGRTPFLASELGGGVLQDWQQDPSVRPVVFGAQTAHWSEFLPEGSRQTAIGEAGLRNWVESGGRYVWGAGVSGVRRAGG